MQTNPATQRLLPLLEKWNWHDATIIPLDQDASFRRYFRLQKNQKTVILMDASPSHENLPAFINITQHLYHLGIRAPEIYQYDLAAGIALLEDVGQNTFTKLLTEGINEKLLYQQALESLIRIHQNPGATRISIDNYDWHHFLTEIKLFTEWFLPFLSNKKTSGSCQKEFETAWKQIYDTLPKTYNTLVLRDFHVDNLMLKNSECVLLDYQDALIGTPFYDLVSLLEDARHNVNLDVVNQIIQQYRQAMPEISDDVFRKHYAIWGAQRHCKVAGIFVRLYKRDGKDSYLKYLPRVIKLLQVKTAESILQPFSDWLNKYNIDLTTNINLSNI